MSTIAQGIDARGYLIGWTQAMTDMYLKDINAMDEASFTTSPGGVARPVNELTADMLNMLGWMTSALKGTILPMSQDDYKAMSLNLTTKDAIAAAVQKSVGEFCGALGAASDETLNANITAPWGMETPTFILCQIAANHIWYHDAQLNYIQALGGDGEVHWM